MEQPRFSNSQIINGIALGFSLAFFLSAITAAFYTGVWGNVAANFYRILISPCPLVTDYFEVGGLASAMLNASACGMACTLFMIFLKGESHANTLAGYFLVVAHCFYGLNFLNMWPCFLAPFLYFRLKKLDFKRNLHICMFSTSFAPFISELLFRYTQENYIYGQVDLTVSGILLTLLFSLVLGFVIPAILPGAKAWHKGYNLYNGGLAFGIFGFFVYNFMYKTMGITFPGRIELQNPLYEQFGHSFHLYANCFFILLFLLCIITGCLLNGSSFKGYSQLIRQTGYGCDFADTYGMPLCLINLGAIGFVFLIYLNLIIAFTKGSGFTGPTIGVLLAALTFSALGQHPKNIWPILAGYHLLYFITLYLCHVNGRELTWTLSTQAYINGAAFATGLCPITGRYGIRAGMAAGLLCASMCTATSALHGSLVLYNGGFTAGTTALILLPILEHYVPSVRERMKEPALHFDEMIALIKDGDELQE